MNVSVTRAITDEVKRDAGGLHFLSALDQCNGSPRGGGSIDTEHGVRSQYPPAIQGPLTQKADHVRCTGKLGLSCHRGCGPLARSRCPVIQNKMVEERMNARTYVGSK